MFLVSCSAFGSSPLEFFTDKEEAIRQGIKAEGLKKEDILGEILENGEIFVFYKKNLEDGLGVGVSSIYKKNDKYSWYDSEQDVVIQGNNHNFDVNWILNTKTGNQYKIYVGMADSKDIPEGISPIIDQKTGIYYHVEFL
ncbi:hypothetical protein J27TS8_39790 [Robertmurraya siralis]|uniref:Uncharacterized protein n=1 Tax=Robertmurraya siralis TaxID=77777 RepID=A0A919WKX5_9BACI|nr:hypothetical protein [Robertmurraya siralis]GIN63986.1 hypothetical protein J27TS8_39790 [Robertmurraya siralis]